MAVLFVILIAVEILLLAWAAAVVLGFLLMCFGMIVVTMLDKKVEAITFDLQERRRLQGQSDRISA